MCFSPCLSFVRTRPLLPNRPPQFAYAAMPPQAAQQGPWPMLFIVADSADCKLHIPEAKVAWGHDAPSGTVMVLHTQYLRQTPPLYRYPVPACSVRSFPCPSPTCLAFSFPRPPLFFDLDSHFYSYFIITGILSDRYGVLSAYGVINYNVPAGVYSHAAYIIICLNSLKHGSGCWD